MLAAARNAGDHDAEPMPRGEAKARVIELGAQGRLSIALLAGCWFLLILQLDVGGQTGAPLGSSNISLPVFASVLLILAVSIALAIVPVRATLTIAPSGAALLERHGLLYTWRRAYAPQDVHAATTVGCYDGEDGSLTHWEVRLLIAGGGSRHLFASSSLMQAMALVDDVNAALVKPFDPSRPVTPDDTPPGTDVEGLSA